MGIAYLMWMYGDALDEVTPDSPNWVKSCAETGEAVLRLTRDVAYFAGAGPKRRTVHALGHTANAVNYCDEALSGDQRLYLWSGNRLVRLSRAGDDEVAFAEGALAREKLVREKRRHSAD